MVEHSVIMTVYNREPDVLLATLRSLWRSLGEGDEIIVVNDGSKMKYEWVMEYAHPRFARFRWIDAPYYEAFRIAGEFNNPARAFNIALEAATGRDIFIMSSDVIVTPKAVQRGKSFRLDEMAWTPRVVDIESGAEYCGTNRLFPMPWFLGCSRRHAVECGGWDEAYLDGMCWEDNDFVGRLMLHTGRFIGDWDVTVYHQSHNQPAYDVKDPEVLAANQRNKNYTKQKWAGLPFAGAEDGCFDVLRKRYETGDVVHECVAYGDTLDQVIVKTRSPFVGLAT